MDQFVEEQKTNSMTATDAMYERIRRYFDEQAPNEQGISVEVRQGQQQRGPDEREVRRSIQFILPDGALMEGYYRIANVGGNMYSVEACVGRRCGRFSVSLPDASLAADNAYGKPVCEFLMEEIKRVAGELYLRSRSTPATG
ncbi:MAG TPA: hypothetical protein VFG50_02445 [Rhodothermales bacterium]|nr:hypothetical protein [Rhodothermales bacterium]